ncbi:hypothetical protein ACWGID_13485 [Kribbella sp. NPDC054772]
MTELPGVVARPDGVDDATVAAVGAFTSAMETVIRARGALYEFHQLTGKADNELVEAVRLLREAGHEQVADDLEKELVGRNVNDGRWTFQIVEDYEQTYYEPWAAHHRTIRRELTGDHPHQLEAEMKRERATPGEPHHGF